MQLLKLYVQGSLLCSISCNKLIKQSEDYSVYSSWCCDTYSSVSFQICDFKELDQSIRDAKSVVVVGGGFLGSELACALGHRGNSFLSLS